VKTVSQIYILTREPTLLHDISFLFFFKIAKKEAKYEKPDLEKNSKNA
jgi:hypothetical protein